MNRIGKITMYNNDNNLHEIEKKLMKPMKSNNLCTYIYDKEVIIFNKNTKEEYTLGIIEYKLLSSLNGNVTIDELINEFPDVNVYLLIKVFYNYGLLNICKKRKTVFRHKLNILNFENAIRGSYKWIYIVCNYLMYISVPLLLFGIFITKTKLNLISHNQIYKLSTVEVILFLLAIIISIILHEFGHALFAIYYGAHVPEMGIMFLGCIPYAAYTSIIGLSKINSKWKRIKILLGGFLVNLNLAGTNILLLRILPFRWHSLLIGICVFNIVITLTNICIFLKGDGYYILEQLLEEKNLFENAFHELKNFLFNFNRPKIKDSFRDFVDTAFYLIYACLTVLYFIYNFLFFLFIYSNFAHKF